ncbi:hypothetical protein CL629_02375 [bacterium]|nr:hypothetical protein [bacterium]|tara:strand:- start:2051 stop:3565 length:1515 start_codon:yes stop_codon:yes gene_type:complete
MSKTLLIDAMPIKLTLDESGEDGKVVARGEFARCDVATQNGRKYSRALYEREVKKLQDMIGRRRCFGELDHPADGKTMLQRVSHLVTKLSINDDGRVMGEAEILNTPHGKTLKAILEAGAEAGVSSRGFGSTKPNKDGSQDVGEDFVLRTFDFVADPAMHTAYPDIFTEDVDNPEFTAEDLANSFPDLFEEATQLNTQESIEDILESERQKVRSEMEEVFASKLAEALVGVRESLREDVREEYESSESSQAHVALHKISQIVAPMVKVLTPDQEVVHDALRAEEDRNSALEAELLEAKNLLRISGFAMHVESKVGGHPKREMIKRLLGKVSHYEDAEQLNERIEEIISEFAVVVEAEREKDSELAQDLREEVDQITDELRELTSNLDDVNHENNQLKSKLKRALDENRHAKVDAYKQQKASGYTNSQELMSLLEGAGDETQIDKVVDQYGRQTVSDSGLESLRQRVKRGNLRQESTLIEEKRESLPLSLDVSFSEIKALAGLKQ